jgi:hypothetical protein
VTSLHRGDARHRRVAPGLRSQAAPRGRLEYRLIMQRDP